MNKVIISPSILSANFSNLEKDIISVERAGAEWLHIDVMDGHFVPNITIGVPVVKSIRKITNLPRFWILSPFFQKNSERSRQKPERNRQKQRRKIHHFQRTHLIGETSKTCLVKPATEHMSNF